MGGCFSQNKSHRKSIGEIQTVHLLNSQFVRRPTLVHTLTWPVIDLFRNNQSASITRKEALSKTPNSLFSEYEENLILKSWKIIAADQEGFGRNVYRRIFECEPNLKTLFSWKDLQINELDSNPTFRRQASSIIGLIDNCVQNVKNIKCMVETLNHLGKYHTRFRGFGFKPEHWIVFKLSIMMSIALALEEYDSEQSLLEIWDVLITFIIETMVVGFNEELKNRFGSSTTYHRHSTN